MDPAVTNNKAGVGILSIAVFVQLATYVARDTGRLTGGRLYWTLIYASSIAALGAAIWIYRNRRSA